MEKVVFDHHAGAAPDWVPASNVVISDDGALATTFAGILAERELAVTPLEATALALGIHEDTGSLTYPSATQRDAEALGWCMRHGARQDLLATFLHTPLAEGDRELLGDLLESAVTHDVAGIQVLVAAVTWPVYVEGVSNLAHKLVDLTDCQALLLLVEMDERVFCVVRSRTPDLDAAAAAATLGGGGHPQAASAIFKGPLEEARARLLEGLDSAARQPLRARDVMSRPVRSRRSRGDGRPRDVVCQRHGQSGVLVTHEDRLVGAVGREDLDKAIGHGLSHAPVKGIMSDRVPTAAEETPLAELQRLLGTSPEGRVAVVSEGKVTGVVARSDLLQALGKSTEGPRRWKASPRASPNSTDWSKSSKRSPRLPRTSRGSTSWGAPSATSCWASGASTWISPSRETPSPSHGSWPESSVAGCAHTISSALQSSSMVKASA